MILAVNIISILLLAAIAVQDFKYRGISWFLLPMLLVALLIKSYLTYPVNEIFFSFLVNLGFVLLQIIMLIAFFSFKERRFVNIINTKMGIGDILFFIAICGVFSPVNFIIFYLGGIVFTLVGVMAYHLAARKQIGEIPLAGCIAVLMIICISYLYFNTNLNPQDDTLLSGVFLPSPVGEGQGPDSYRERP